MNIKIGLDIDGVLYDWHEIAYQQYNKGESYEDFWTGIRANPDSVFTNNIVNDPTLYCKVTIRNDYVNIVKHIDFICDELHYITSRPLSVERNTTKLFKQSGMPKTDNILFVGNGKSKLQTILDLGCNVIVEDQPNYVEELVDQNIIILLMDRTYNRNFNELQYDNVVRVYDMYDVLDYIRESINAG